MISNRQVGVRAAGFSVWLCLGTATISSAQRDFTEEELRSLPRACVAQQQIHRALRVPVVSEVEREQWSARLGPDYSHYHHYCWALIFVQRANKAESSQHRNGAYRAAVENFQYVIRAASPSFALLPEVFLRKGMTLRLLGEDGPAATEFLNAIRLKEDYTPAYSALIDLHLDLGNEQLAREVLEMGLRHAPNSKILVEKQAALASGVRN